MARSLDVLMLFSETMESTSSSDDKMISNILNSRVGIERPKVEGCTDVIDEYSDEEFKKNFRLTRQTFARLKQMFQESPFHSSLPGGTPRISVDIQLLAFSWYSGNKAMLRDVAGRFGIAESTLHTSNENVMDFLNTIAKGILKFPKTDEEKKVIARQFEAITGIPGDPSRED